MKYSGQGLTPGCHRAVPAQDAIHTQERCTAYNRTRNGAMLVHGMHQDTRTHVALPQGEGEWGAPVDAAIELGAIHETTLLEATHFVASGQFIRALSGMARMTQGRLPSWSSP